MATVVCKATYDVMTGALVANHRPLRAEDGAFPNDLAATRTNAEVVLVRVAGPTIRIAHPSWFEPGSSVDLTVVRCLSLTHAVVPRMVPVARVRRSPSIDMVALRADTLVVDADHARAEIIYRASFGLASSDTTLEVTLHDLSLTLPLKDPHKTTLILEPPPAVEVVALEPQATLPCIDTPVDLPFAPPCCPPSTPVPLSAQKKSSSPSAGSLRPPVAPTFGPRPTPAAFRFDEGETLGQILMREASRPSAPKPPELEPTAPPPTLVMEPEQRPSPRETITLQEYGALLAAIEIGQRPFAGLLEEQGLDEQHWRSVAAEHERSLRASLRRGDGHPRAQVDEAYVQQLERELGVVSAELFERVSDATTRGDSERLMDLGWPDGAAARVMRVMLRRPRARPRATMAGAC